MRTLFFVVGLGLVLLIGARDAEAFAPTQSVRGAEILRIPFAPPAGEDMAYDVTIAKLVNGKESVGETRQSLRFERSENGYLLTISYVRIVKDAAVIDLVAPGGMDHVPAELRPFLLPMAFDVAEDGSLSRIRNWPELKRVISMVPDVLAAMEKDTTKRDGAIQIGRRIVEPYLNMTAEQAPTILLKGWSSLFGYGGTELEAGAEYEGNGEIQALLPIMLPLTLRYSLTREPSGSGLRYRRTSQIDQKAAADVISRYLLQMVEGLNDDQSANVRKVAEMVKDANIEDELDVLLDFRTGLVEHATVERKITMQGVTGGERIVVKRVR